MYEPHSFIYQRVSAALAQETVGPDAVVYDVTAFTGTVKTTDGTQLSWMVCVKRGKSRGGQ